MSGKHLATAKQACGFGPTDRDVGSTAQGVQITDALKELLRGGLGSFWPVHRGVIPNLNRDEPLTGFLREEEGTLRLHLIRDDPLSGPRESTPVGFLGTTEHSGVVVRDIVRSTDTISVGGGRESMSRYTALTVVAEPRIDLVRNLNLSSASAVFQGDSALDWGAFSAVDRKIRTDKKGRIQRIQLDLRSVPDRSTRLRPSSRLVLSAHWRANPEPSRGHAIDTGVKVTVESDYPSVRTQLITPLLRVQDLLGIAFEGFYTSGEAGAVLVGAGEPAPLWNADLMGSAPTHGREADHRSFPVVSLSDIGGVEGVAKWVLLCRAHPRAVRPIIDRLREGALSPEVQALELASAIEYWVASHRIQGRRWAQKSRAVNPVAALANRVGPEFAIWIGDPDSWARSFWDHYNGLKHSPQYRYERRDLRLLAEGAHRLLTAALLNRIALSRTPSTKIFRDHRNNALGRELRDLV